MKKRRPPRKRREAALKKKGEIVALLKQYDISEYIEKAKRLDRKFILHIGPTNSGKTYDAIQALRQAKTGVYLGPLRLLALEMYDTLNSYGALCELLTGEEFIRVPGADLTASTIELCDFRKRYDVAVIDEAQMISDPHRGGAWTKAIFLVDAAEVHICLSPAAENLIVRILKSFEAIYEIHRHERLAPLTFAGKIDSMKEVRDGDAVIVFSRRAVLATAAELPQLAQRHEGEELQARGRGRGAQQGPAVHPGRRGRRQLLRVHGAGDVRRKLRHRQPALLPPARGGQQVALDPL